MEASSSSANVSRNSSSRNSRAPEREKDNGEKTKHPAPRSTRYKDKFQALREKYDQVVSTREDYQKDLDAANARMKKLQAENDLLLDAMNLAVNHQPHLHPFITPPQLSPEQERRSGAEIDSNYAPTPRHAPVHSHISPHMNGNSNGTSRTNGSSKRRSMDVRVFRHPP
ncbi:hypothetical protein BD779DRAFT_1525712 [Infundibulicybe gibba]|nr:hypothetical protein BD779DRAFT_1525712 [Infundibulicybe gibba]